MKRPAASGAHGRSKRHASAEVPPSSSFTHANFNLKEFVQALWRAGGYAPTGKQETLAIFEGCAGTGTPGHVLEVALGSERVLRIGAVEKDPAAVNFLMRNFYRKGCVYGEMAEIAARGKARCMAHGSMCKLAPPTEVLYICGFDCEKFSCQFADRFKTDVIATPSHHDAS